MPLFPRLVPHSTRTPPMDLATFLSLLSEDESNPSSYHHNQSPSHISPSHRRNGSNIRTFNPNFDLIETSQTYILQGELPGLTDKRSVDIEFTDQQTLVVKGKIEKFTHTTTPAPSAAKQVTDTEHESHPRPHTPPKPTVEDDVDEDDDGKSTILTPTTTSSTVVESKSSQEARKEEPGKEKIKYWVSERTIGSFQRAFSFPGLIDQDNVKAKLENGLLTIVVPKRAKMAARKVEVQ